MYNQIHKEKYQRDGGDGGEGPPHTSQTAPEGRGIGDQEEDDDDE